MSKRGCTQRSLPQRHLLFKSMPLRLLWYVQQLVALHTGALTVCSHLTVVAGYWPVYRRKSAVRCCARLVGAGRNVSKKLGGFNLQRLAGGNRLITLGSQDDVVHGSLNAGWQDVQRICLT